MCRRLVRDAIGHLPGRGPLARLRERLARSAFETAVPGISLRHQPVEQHPEQDP